MVTRKRSQNGNETITVMEQKLNSFFLLFPSHAAKRHAKTQVMDKHGISHQLRGISRNKIVGDGAASGEILTMLKSLNLT